MRCPQCGNEISAGFNVCAVCGYIAENASSSMGQQGYGAAPQQNYGATPQQGYGAVSEPTYGAAPRQNYGAAPQQNYGAVPEQGYGAAPQRGYGAIPEPGYGADPQQGYMPGQNYGSSPVAPAPPKAKKKSHLGLIIGIISGVLVITAAVLLIFVFDVFSSKNGTYKLEGGSDEFDMTLVVDGENGTFSLKQAGTDKSTGCTVTFEDSTVRVESNGTTLRGTYDKSEKTVTFTREALVEAEVLSSSADGTYKIYAAKMYGLELTQDQLATYGLDTNKYTIKITGDKATLDMGGTSSSCDVSQSGDSLTFYSGGESISGTYNKDEGTLTISYSGVEMIFKSDGAGSGSENRSYVLKKTE